MPSDHEAPFGCPHFPDCPGCPWVGRPYAAQLTSKHARVAAALDATLPAGSSPLIEAVAAAPDQTGYRVQAKLMVGTSPLGTILGLYAPGSHRILDVSRCPLHDPLLQRTIPMIRKALTDAAVPLHGHHRTGVRYVLVRTSIAEARVLVTVVSSRAPLPNAAQLARRLRAASLPLTGLLINENTTAGNVILGARTECVWGEAVLRERYGDVTLAAGPTAFVQANTRMAAQIYAAIAAAAELGARGRVLDLYCGVGGIALTLARRATSVLGIEEIGAAVVAARMNAERAGAHHARFVTGRVEDTLAGRDATVDVVTMNPPRKGCGAGVAQRLATLAPPRLLYLSCNPESFARDAAQLLAGGFILERVQPFDLLPQTEHVELLGTFVRAARR